MKRRKKKITFRRLTALTRIFTTVFICDPCSLKLAVRGYKTTAGGQSRGTQRNDIVDILKAVAFSHSHSHTHHLIERERAGADFVEIFFKVYHVIAAVFGCEKRRSSRVLTSCVNTAVYTELVRSTRAGV